MLVAVQGSGSRNVRPPCRGSRRCRACPNQQVAAHDDGVRDRSLMVAPQKSALYHFRAHLSRCTLRATPTI